MAAGQIHTKRLLSCIVVAGLVVLALPFATAFAQDFVELPPELDARAARLYDGIMCPICNGQTISQSNSEIAGTMRQMVRERLLAGDSDKEIHAFMADAFGQDILASPPTEGLGLAVWTIPPLAVLLGAVIVTIAIRRLRRSEEARGASVGASSGPAPERDPYLVLVDREIEGRP